MTTNVFESLFGTFTKPCYAPVFTQAGRFKGWGYLIVTKCVFCHAQAARAYVNSDYDNVVRPAITEDTVVVIRGRREYTSRSGLTWAAESKARCARFPRWALWPKWTTEEFVRPYPYRLVERAGGDVLLAEDVPSDEEAEKFTSLRWGICPHCAQALAQGEEGEANVLINAHKLRVKRFRQGALSVAVLAGELAPEGGMHGWLTADGETEALH